MELSRGNATSPVRKTMGFLSDSLRLVTLMCFATVTNLLQCCTHEVRHMNFNFSVQFRSDSDKMYVCIMNDIFVVLDNTVC